ncbi:hypothetical protein ACHQM5_011155 [Ranunculus cassubicifolius]
MKERYSKRKIRLSRSGEDIISKLPDDILHHILSFLPTSSAVSTSALSTRWRDLWTSVPVLEFCGQSRFYSNFYNIFQMPKDFEEFVDRVMHFNDTGNIKKFSFSSWDCYAFPFDTWIAMAVRRNVQELILTLTRGGPPPSPLILPSCFFSSESLTTLKIWANNKIEIPSTISFPSLNTLHFGDITFILRGTTEQVTFMCPVLTECVFYRITWKEFNSIKIISPQLKSLSIDDSILNGLYYLGEGVIEVSAESLTSLELITPNPDQYSLQNLSSLIDAKIELVELKETKHYVNLLRGLSTVKDLTLGFGSIEIFSHPDLLAYLHATSSLKRLTIGYLWSFRLPKDPARKRLIDILSCTPKIEFLSFPQGSFSYPFGQLGWIHGSKPVCFLPCLKVIEIRMTEWRTNELRLLDFFLKNVEVLERISVEGPICDWNRRKMSEKLGKLQLPRGSKCVIECIRSISKLACTKFLL